MKPYGTRKLGLLLALACAVAQPAFGSSLVSSALTLGLYSTHPHAHSVALHSDGNHLDVVLSHGEPRGHDDRELPADHDHPVSLTHGDHVVHITGIEPSSATPRRAILDPAPVLALRVTLPVASAPACIVRTLPEPRARGVEELRTIVLRL